MTNIHILITINWFKIGMTKLSKILCTNLYLDCTRMRCFVGKNFSAVSHPKVIIYNADLFSVVGWSGEIRCRKDNSRSYGTLCTVGWSLAVHLVQWKWDSYSGTISKFWAINWNTWYQNSEPSGTQKTLYPIQPLLIPVYLCEFDT